MKKTILLLLLLSVSTITGMAQTTFAKIFGETYANDYGTGVLQVEDGSFLMCGIELFVSDDISNEQRGIVRRLDGEGNVIWTINYATDIEEELGDTYLVDIVATADGNFVVIGESPSDTNSDVFVSKFNVEGEVIWYKKYEVNYPQSLAKVIALDNGDVVVTGTSIEDWQILAESLYLIRIDSEGEMIWEYIHPNSSNNAIRHKAYSVVEDAAGDFVAVGSITASDTTAAGIFMVGVSAEGALMWATTQPYVSGEGRDVFVKDNGNIVVAGWCLPEAVVTPVVLEVDVEGEVVGEYLLGDDEEVNEWAYAFTQNENEEITMLSFNQEGEAYIVQTDDAYVPEWREELVIESDEDVNLVGNDVVRTDDGGFACVGSFSAGNDVQAVLFKLNANGIVSTSDMAESSVLDIRVSPNPAQDFVVVDTKDKASISHMEIYDYQGRQLLQKANSNSLYVGGLETGMYLLKVYTNEGEIIQKIIIE